MGAALLPFRAWPAHAAARQSARFPVYVTASFLDKNNLFIENLGREEVEILEDGQPRAIEFMAQEELPAVYGIVFDRAMLGEGTGEARTPGGPASPATAARSVVYELIDKYLGKQTVWVGCYDRQLQVALDFTTDGFQAQRVIQQLEGRRNPEDSNLYGALFSSVERMTQRHERRRILIFVLESVDSGTLAKLNPLKNLLSASNVEMFFLRFGSRLSGRLGGASPQMSEGAIRELAGATSGGAFSAMDYGEHLEDVTRRLHNYLRTLYTFGFQSESGRDRRGRLAIRCLRPGSKVKVRPTVPLVP